MAIYIKKSTDAGALVITQSAGSFIALLDFLLVTTAGWTKEFSGANLACYRAPIGTSRFRLYVDDTSTTVARLIGYEEMTSIGAGTGPFPTSAQLSGGLYLNKATAADWKFFSNGKIFYLFCKYGTTWCVHAFGDFISDKAADSFAAIHIGQHTAATSTSNFAILGAALAGTLSGHYVARPYTQIGGSIPITKFSDSVRSNAGATLGSNGTLYPNPVSGSLNLAPVWIGEGTTASGTRGLLPGIWNPLHLYPLADGDTFGGTGALAGRTFEAVCPQTIGAQQCFVETSDTWGDI